MLCSSVKLRVAVRVENAGEMCGFDVVTAVVVAVAAVTDRVVAVVGGVTDTSWLQPI